MTDDDRKHWESIVKCNHDVPAIQAADAELKRLREAKEGICECGADAKQCAENREHHKIHLNRMGGE